MRRGSLCSFSASARGNARRVASPVPSPALHLLDWSRPLPHAAAEHLARHWPGDGPLDLGDHLIIVPTRRAGRRLREALAAHAARHRQAVFPPRVLLPEQLLSEALAPATTASAAHMLVAWIEVLRAVRFREFDAVFPVEPAEPGFAWAARLAAQFLQLQSTLVENGLRFADVPERAAPFPELRRWSQLAELERRFEAQLAARDLVSQHAARIQAASAGSPPAGIRSIVLIATPDPMPLVLRRLEALAARTSMEILVHGPSLDAFDAWGRPASESWIQRGLPLAAFEEHVHPCADPSEQAERIAAMARAHLQAGAPPDGMLGIAVADHEVVAPLHHALNQAGIRSYDPEGTPHRRGELFRVLDLLLSLVEEPAFDTACSFLRCPAVLEWLAHESGPGFSPAALLEALDAIRATHLPATLADAREQARSHAPRRGEALWEPAARALEAVDSLAALAARSFPDGVQAAMARIHARRRLHLARPEDAVVVAAAETWADTARAMAEAFACFGRPPGREAWRLALQRFGETCRFDEKPDGAVELQGWLELPWDDAPHLVVSGFNEGRVPSAVVGDAFLPESLREQLGLRTNAMRLARDAYLVHALIASRSRSGRVDILLGRTSAAGDPLRPSRLLLLCEPPELPHRVEFLFREIPAPAGGAAATAWRRAWRLAPPAPLPVDSVSVTAFRDHLACPFRFYLRHALHMREVDPYKEELDALDFGNLVHHALEGLYYEPAMRRSTDVAAIRAFLTDRLDGRARALYGSRVPVPLLVQLESARQRLAHAAGVHAAGVADGWFIHAVEQKFVCAIGAITVTGRVDRIDRHEPSGAVRVLDYKTFDQPKTPRTTHTRKVPARPAADAPPPPAYARFTAPDGADLIWTDLQLPLYRRALAGQFGAAIAVGYFNLPKAATETGINLWEEFDEAWQAKADHCAEGVAAAIADGVFWPPAEDTAYADEFARLFHEGTAASVAWSSNPRCAP